MLPVEEFKVMDTNAIYLGVPIEYLMEEAGKAVASVINEQFGSDRRIAVVCGSGNNAGDGLVAARHLLIDNHVRVFMLKPLEQVSSDLTVMNGKKIRSIIYPIEEFDPSHFDIIVDALLGTGFDGDVRETYAKPIAAINGSSAKVVSIDVPSGFLSGTAVRPDITVTFEETKLGMDESNSGKVVVSVVGIPDDAKRYVGPGEFIFYPLPGRESHKGQNGRVLIVGGGPYTGAPALSGMAALRTGVDLVHIATPEAVRGTIASYSPNLIVHPLSGSILTMDDVDDVVGLMSDVDAVLIGPGLGSDPETKRAIRAIVERCDLPMVLDADAIGSIDRAALNDKEGVLTPHKGEYARMTGSALPTDLESQGKDVKSFAFEMDMVIITKGNVDVISDGKRVKYCRTGNFAMTVGGTGDVLAGIICGLMSKGVGSWEAARLGAFINGFAGDLAYDEMRFSMLATDLIDRIHLVLNRFLEGTD